MAKQQSIVVLVLLIIWFPVSAVAHAETAIKSKFVDFDGVRLHYYDIGEGTKALVLVHGWTCSADFWLRNIDAFPDYRVIAVDLPGHGQSDSPKTDYTMDYFAQSVAAVMGGAGVTDAILVGHSMGTVVIRQFYRLHPEQAAGLVLVDGALQSNTRERKKIVAKLRADYATAARTAVDSMLRPTRNENLKHDIRSRMLGTSDFVGLSSMEHMLDEENWAPNRIDVPVLAILAETSGWNPNTKPLLRSIAPNLDLQMWRGVGHFVMLEQPTAFNTAVRLFVARNNLL